eukprot:CAMPEP_0119325824 /NCGR_PEP_ID=MMETSP1333-20130426/66774_1 /TAXON_ID=418940 /ORGANISM="Scyphosphaera apsteinii, Strain RCC1455" /LENGTH=30 /DNA_ID= /DNA_START= /DNA_END= /DNA_ORIENTATION=
MTTNITTDTIANQDQNHDNMVTAKTAAGDS